jgi:glycosyltransferase involved in cell wall biosynthesis
LPFISICIPTYNRAEFIEAAVRSALEQTYPNFEIVVVDDGSTDATPEIMRRLACEKIRYIIKEHSGGPKTRNRCIAEARGDFIVWLDSDDVILPGTLARYTAELGLHPDVDVLYGDLQIANEKLVSEGLWVYRNYHGWRESLLSDTMLENRIPNVCTLVRKSCYTKVGDYNDAFPRAHDYEFWTRLVPVGIFKRVNAPVGIYRRHDQSLSKVSKKPDTSFEARAVKAMIERHGLRSLFPFAYGISTSSVRGDAYGWMIASLLMLKYADFKAAMDFATRSVDSMRLSDNETLRSLLDQTLNGKSGIRTKDAGSNRANEFQQFVETATHAYGIGQSGMCAKACARLS